MFLKTLACFKNSRSIENIYHLEHQASGFLTVHSYLLLDLQCLRSIITQCFGVTFSIVTVMDVMIFNDLIDTLLVLDM